jgi:hypothetical protein
MIKPALAAGISSGLTRYGRFERKLLRDMQALLHPQPINAQKDAYLAVLIVRITQQKKEQAPSPALSAFYTIKSNTS